MKNLIVASALGLAACGDDLPEGWKGADEIEVQQTECSSQPMTDPVQNASFMREGGELVASFETSRIRCNAEACGYHQRKDGKEQILIQPCDMHPSSVAKCVCAYGIVARAPVPGEAFEAQLYLRGDAYAGDPGAPTLVASQSIEAQTRVAR